VRCPGSINQKTGKRAAVEVTPKQDGGILQLIAPYADKEQEFEYKPIVLESNANLTEVIPHLNGRARQFLLDGVQSPGRHNACFATCKNLYELGVPAELAFHWLCLGADKCRGLDKWGGPFKKPLDIRDVRATWARVYGKEAR
jgi:hypothetical protein